MDLHQILILLVAALTGWIFYKRFRLFSKMAPGPYGFPFVGSLFHFTTSNALEEMQKLKQKYGKIYSFSAGDFYITVVMDYKMVISNLKRDELQGRPDFEVWEVRNGGTRNRGILFNDGPVWNEQRRFALRSLRDFGFGKESMEGMLVHELQELQSVMRKNLGHPMSLSGLFNASVLNSLWYIITGKRFELDDPKLTSLIQMLIENIRNSQITTPGLFWYTPVKYGLIGKQLHKNNETFRERIGDVLSQEINEHLETYQEGDVRDFIDSYIQQIKQSSAESSFYSEEGKSNLKIVMFDLFVAGAETTSTTLQWAMLYLAHHPHVQKKAQEEIDSVIGKSRPPNRSDKPKMIYLEAVLHEVHRMASLVPVSVYHKALQDTEIEGYFVPKNSVIFFSIYDAHHDKEVWGDPDKFRPERFLDASGTKVMKPEALIPFSSGKRQCLGETLARDTLFIFLAGLLQTFTFEIDPAQPNQEMKGSGSFISSPFPFQVIIKERK